MYHKINFSFGYGFIFLMVIIASLQSCASTKDQGRSGHSKGDWQIAKTDKKETPGWVIYTRKIVNTNFLEYKIEGGINASPSACVASFREDIHNQAAKVKNKKFPTYDIVASSSDSLLTYVVHNEPFPMKDTEMSVRYLFYSDDDGSLGVRWKEAWDIHAVRPSKKLKRVETFRGSWEFRPMPDGACKAANSVQFDPKKMPMWLVRPMVFKFLKNGLKDIREMTANL